MSMQGLEALTVDEYIFTKLTDPVTGLLDLVPPPGLETLPQVHSDTVPPDVEFPYVIFQMQSNSDTMTTDGTRVLWLATYFVKGVDRSESYVSLAPIASRIDQLLHKASGVVTTGQVLHSRRISVIRYPELTDAVNYRHFGGSYRFWTQAT